MERLSVRDIMSKEAVSAGADEPVLDLISGLVKYDVGAIVITNPDRSPVGMVTRRDILEFVLSNPADYYKFTAADISKSPPVTVPPGLDVLTAYAIMKKNRINRLPVVEENRLCGMITHRDISNSLSERVEILETSHEDMKKKMNNDFLTGIYNRGYMDDELAYFTESACRTGVTFTLLLIDIDNFKAINDTYGHLCGDMILKGAAETFVEKSRNVSRVGRFGGDEFMIIAPYSDYNSASYMAERLRMSLEERVFSFEGREIRITASIGLIEWSQDVKDSREMLMLADNCLYAAKKAGKNRVSTCGIEASNDCSDSLNITVHGIQG